MIFKQKTENKALLTGAPLEETTAASIRRFIDSSNIAIMHFCSAKYIKNSFWEEGQGRRGEACLAPTGLPPDPSPNPQKGPERWASGPTFRSKSVKGLGKGCGGKGPPALSPLPRLASIMSFAELKA